MNEQIVSTLTEKLGQTSLSNRSLTDYVSQNLPPEGTEVDDAWYNKHVTILKSFNGNFSADMARTITEQIPAKSVEYFLKNPDAFKKFLADHPDLVDKQPPPVETEEAKRIKALEDALAEMKKNNETASKNAQLATLRQSALSACDTLNVAHKAIWEDAVASVSVEENETSETFLNKVKSAYSTNVKRYFGDGAKPYTNTEHGGGGNGSNAAIDRFFARKAQEEGWSK